MLKERVRLPLLMLRLGVAVVFWVWVADKFINADHTVRVWKAFYFALEIPVGASYIIGLFQGLIILAFTLGIAKKWSYGLIFLMHLGSTLLSYFKYLEPFEGLNILFFAAWPMLAACFALYCLRDFDTMGTVKIGESKQQET